MATKIHYFGDVSIASKYKASGEILLETLRKTNFVPSSLNRDFPDGTKVIAKRVTPDMETIDIWAGAVTTKDRWVWTLLYAPCPLPDSQDWGGWIEADRDTLEATNFLGDFFLLGWGENVWGDFTPGDISSTTSDPTDSITDLGWSLYASSVQPGTIPPGTAYYGPVWLALGIIRYSTVRGEQSYVATFPYDLIPAVSVTNWSESGAKAWTSHGGIYGHPEGYIYIDSSPYGVTTPPQCSYPDDWSPIPPNAPGFTRAHGEGYLSWESSYMIGFWKWEWTAYNPSSFLNMDNYVLFYDYYSSDDSYSSTYLSDMYTFIMVVGGQYWYSPYTYYTPQMVSEYVGVLGSGLSDHLNTSYSVIQTYTDGSLHVAVHDPDSVGGVTSRASINYETHICGKYEGVWFDEVIGSATWSGTLAWGEGWSGDCVFAWMGRFYHKAQLLEGDEGEEAPSNHHLMLASWLKGPAAGNASGTNKIPGCTGITATAYRMKHGVKDVTKEYGASHPGWHDVYTDEDGRTWRAYGDLFAALKKVRG